MAMDDGRAGGAGLTARERAALAGYSAGLDTAQIADRLGVGRDAVRADLRSATAKLGARSPLEAILRALRAGLITLP
jgi:DNA-binding CsgD family transcriptional regulator